MMRDDEQAIVARAKAGDDEAFRQLVVAHSHDLFRLAYRLTGSRENADDVSELIQVARTETDPHLRKSAFEKLSIMDDDAAVDFMMEILEN